MAHRRMDPLFKGDDLPGKSWLSDVEPLSGDNQERDPEAASWYYCTEKGSFGPVTREHLVALARAGHFGAEDMVWAPHARAWVQAKSVYGLFDGDLQGVPEDAGAPSSPPLGLPGGSVSYGDYSELDSKAGAAFFDSLILALLCIPACCCLTVSTDFFTPPMRGVHFTGFTVLEALMFLRTFAAFLLIWILPAWLYYASFESSRWQATLGKRWQGVIVTDYRGHRITFGRATLRFFASLLSRLILYLGYALPDSTGRERTLHDRIAGTVVVNGRR